MSRGIIAINIEKDDELITARITDGQQVIFLATHDGMAIRFNEQDLRPMGRPATGNRGINLRKGDYVIGAAVTPSNEARNKQRLELAAERASPPRSKPSSTKPPTPPPPSRSNSPTDAPTAEILLRHRNRRRRPAKLDKLDEQLGLTPCLILTVSENGFGKRTDVDAYRLQSRGGKGVINMKTTAKIGKVTAINLVDDTTEMMVISQFGKIIRIDTKRSAPPAAAPGRQAPRPRPGRQSSRRRDHPPRRPQMSVLIPAPTRKAPRSPTPCRGPRTWDTPGLQSGVQTPPQIRALAPGVLTSRQKPEGHAFTPATNAK
jgi:DNA gyrase/topoisomerase IV subunit A